MRTLLALAALPLLLGSCSGGGGDAMQLTNDGYASLGKSDWSTAQGQFDDALEAIGGDTSHKQYKRAVMGSIRAKANLDPAAAVTECMQATSAGHFNDDDVAKVGAFLMEASALTEAVDLMDQGLKSFESSVALASLKEKIVAASASDPAVAAQLEGLGYL